ncbi:MAG TPA: cupredoxin domain-containing protein [Alphaproteobacteria bacterium]|nr:cupredoxin domain-containing protein [Alphaproteobacteria bacterium]
MPRLGLALTCFLVVMSMTLPARAEGDFTLTIKDHRYAPEELTIPANTKVKLIVKNLDATPEEFESFDLNREKVVAPGSVIEVYVGPLDPGKYEFFGDFHQDTARGHLLVK